MKACKPGTDQEAEIHVLINGKAATEYALPAERGAKLRDDIVECFIPIEQGDRVTVRGRISGSILSGSIDLLVDGSFLGDCRIEGQEIKHLDNRKIEFKRAISCPIPPGWTSIETPKDMVEGTLQADKVDEETLNDLANVELASREGLTPGLGSLQMVISLCQEPLHERYKDRYLDITNGQWRKRSGSQLVRKSGIPPEFELKLEEDEDGEVSQARAAKHRRHWNQVRAGSKPWAKFVFYYRSARAITAAGCMPRPDKFQELEPGVAKTFVRVEPKAGKKQKTQNKIDATAASPAPSSSSTIQISQGPPAKSAPEKPKDMNKRLGGTLFLAPDVRSPSVEDSNIGVGNASLDGGSTSFHNAVPDAHEGERDEAATETFARDLGDVANSAAIATIQKPVENSHAPKNTRAEFSSLVPSPAQMDEAFHHTINVSTTLIPQTSTQPGPMRAVTAAFRGLPTENEIFAQIPDDGLNSYAMHLFLVNGRDFDNSDAATREFERRRDAVAEYDSEDDSWYTKEIMARRRAAKAAASRRRDSGLNDTRATSDELFGDQDDLFGDGALQTEADLVAIKQEVMETREASLMPAPAPAPATKHYSAPLPTATNSSIKRPTSSRPESSMRATESPAAKRKKTKSGCKAMQRLQEELAAKRALREEAEKKLKDKREAKEAKKRREEEELAELRRLNAEEDAKLAEVQQQLQESDGHEDDEDESDDEDEDEEGDEEHE